MKSKIIFHLKIFLILLSVLSVYVFYTLENDELIDDIKTFLIQDPNIFKEVGTVKKISILERSSRSYGINNPKKYIYTLRIIGQNDTALVYVKASFNEEWIFTLEKNNRI